jgi:nucleotide-binding universal stress UspA family protein/ActR/RegA family two-component response regulator
MPSAERPFLEERPTVVCVDDEPLIRQALYRLLRREPYELYLAETPEEALEYAGAHSVDVVITDQRMPGMSGLELLREMRKSAPEVAGLILTAYPESVAVEDPSELPIPPLFVKPWDDDTLREGISDLLSHRARAKKDSVSWTGVRRVPSEETSPVASSSLGPFAPSVLVFLDGSPDTELALGSVLAPLNRPTSRFHLLRVLPQMGLSLDVYAYLRTLTQRLSRQGFEATADIRWGEPARQILLHARHAKVDLIVLPRFREGWRTRFFGTGVIERICRESEVSLLVCPPKPASCPWRRIAVPLDGSRDAESVLPKAVAWARDSGATLDLVTVEPWPLSEYGPFEGPDRRPYLSEIASHVEAEEVPVEVHCLRGPVTLELHRHLESTEADLVCMTTRGRGGLSRVLRGSTAQELTRTAPCPVFLQRIIRTT